MNIILIKALLLPLSISLVISGCSVAKLEARLEANPQCKDVVNPKTGALMPCPGSDKAFYREVGLAPAKPVGNQNTSAPVSVAASPSATTPSNKTSSTATSAKTTSQQSDCKPQIHKKTGGIMPCPAPD